MLVATSSTDATPEQPDSPSTGASEDSSSSDADSDKKSGKKSGKKNRQLDLPTVKKGTPWPMTTGRISAESWEAEQAMHWCHLWMLSRGDIPRKWVYVVWDNLNTHYDGKDKRWKKFNKRHGGRFRLGVTLTMTLPASQAPTRSRILVCNGEIGPVSSGVASTCFVLRTSAF
ncbi:MAG: hypothetical protein GY811_10890 [Myxococcales bacterium]|nr:hypothetical protein [Myxococcales bacterium]